MRVNPGFARSSIRPTPTADLRNISDLDTPFGQQVVGIYEQAFSAIEREPVETIAARLNQPDGSAEVNCLRVLVEQEAVVGFAHFSRFEGCPLGFLHYLAVLPGLGGCGRGSILLQDAHRQLGADGERERGWPCLGLVTEVERPELAIDGRERQLAEHRIEFYKRNGGVLIKSIDYIRPPLAAGQPSRPLYLMVFLPKPVLWAKRLPGLEHWLRREALRAALVTGYGEDPRSSWYARRALEGCGMGEAPGNAATRRVTATALER